jgi:O-antigen ligase
LGYFQLLGTRRFRFIPVLHNGYMYILVKFGAVGLIVYAYFMTRITLYGRRQSRVRSMNLEIAKDFTSALGMILVFTTLVIAGIFNKSTLTVVLLLVGAFVSLIDRQSATFPVEEE